MAAERFPPLPNCASPSSLTLACCSRRIIQMLNIPALIASLKPVDWMAPPTNVEQLRPRLAYMFGLTMRSLAPGDYGRPVTGGQGAPVGDCCRLAAAELRATCLKPFHVRLQQCAEVTSGLQVAACSLQLAPTLLPS